MKRGTAVRMRIIPSHKNECLRVYDIPYHIVPHPNNSSVTWSQISDEMRFKKVIDKFYPGEIGVVLDTHEELVQVLTPRGISGWLNSNTIETIE